MVLKIELSDKDTQELELRARRQGMQPEQFLQEIVHRVLAEPMDEFEAAARYVLKKNAELMKRLA